MSNYDDGVNDPLYREGGSEGQTAVQPPYQQQPQQPFQQGPQHAPQQPGFGAPPHAQGYGYQGAPGAPYGQGYGYAGAPQPQFGYAPWQRPRRQYPIETKPFFLTSEFVMAVLAVVGIAITAASSDAFGAWRAWILITAVVVGYMVARGIAKSGTRSHSSDPRENLDLNWGRGDSSD